MFNNPADLLNGLATSEVQMRLAAAAAARFATPYFNMAGMLPPSKHLNALSILSSSYIDWLLDFCRTKIFKKIDASFFVSFPAKIFSFFIRSSCSFWLRKYWLIIRRVHTRNSNFHGVNISRQNPEFVGAFYCRFTKATVPFIKLISSMVDCMIDQEQKLWFPNGAFALISRCNPEFFVAWWTLKNVRLKRFCQ